ncbi:hypothetical protein K438DRAFT_1787024 [Mycena galopus ATCC 62051]|nr:hypothetical protein K438DRAFT_1787024 [Mycena galopus ATCC 62051]
MKDAESCVQKSKDRFFEVRREKMERNKKDGKCDEVLHRRTRKTRMWQRASFSSSRRETGLVNENLKAEITFKGANSTRRYNTKNPRCVVKTRAIKNKKPTLGYLSPMKDPPRINRPPTHAHRRIVSCERHRREGVAGILRHLRRGEFTPQHAIPHRHNQKGNEREEEQTRIPNTKEKSKPKQRTNTRTPTKSVRAGTHGCGLRSGSAGEESYAHRKTPLLTLSPPRRARFLLSECMKRMKSETKNEETTLATIIVLAAPFLSGPRWAFLRWEPSVAERSWGAGVDGFRGRGAPFGANSSSKQKSGRERCSHGQIDSEQEYAA